MLWIYIQEGSEFTPFALVSIIFLYFSNRLYFFCWYGVEKLGVQLNLEKNKNISFFHIIGAALIPGFGRIWFPGDMSIILKASHTSYNRKLDDYSQWLLEHIYFSQRKIFPPKAIYATSTSKPMYPKKNSCDPSVGYDESIEQELMRVTKLINDLQSKSVNKPELQKMNETKQMADHLVHVQMRRSSNKNYHFYMCVFCSEWCIEVLFAIYLIFSASAALMVPLAQLMGIVGDIWGDAVWLLNLTIFLYTLLSYFCLLQKRSRKKYCGNKGNRLNTIVDILYGPLIYTFYLIAKLGIGEFMVRLKECKFAFLKLKDSNIDRNRALIEDYMREIHKKSLNKDEYRKTIVLQLLKSFAAIFESFPQLLLQCYVYFIIRSQYNQKESYLILIQFYLSTAFSLISTVRGIIRLLTYNLFSRGLKQAFDFAAFSGTTRLPRTWKQAKVQRYWLERARGPPSNW